MIDENTYDPFDEVMVNIQFRRRDGGLEYRKKMAPTGLPLSEARWTDWMSIADEAIKVVTT